MGSISFRPAGRLPYGAAKPYHWHILGRKSLPMQATFAGGMTRAAALLQLLPDARCAPDVCGPRGRIASRPRRRGRVRRSCRDGARATPRCAVAALLT
jgi:hypothetical protein